MDQAQEQVFAAYQAAARWLLGNIREPAEPAEPRPMADVEERRRRRFARLGTFLDRLGRPERRFLSIHVAGTSGKGSTAAMIAAIGAAAGRRTGLHVTPYLQTPLEKLLINGRPMNIERFVELVWQVRRQVEAFNASSPDGPLRYGELWVALTFAAYAAEWVELGVVEAGLGGRWDSTNVIVPAVAIINRIGLDHVRSLGPTLADIASHKAGIIKPGVPVVVAEQEPAALEVITAEARQQRSTLLLARRDFTWQIRAADSDGSRFDYEDAAGRLSDLSIPLLGTYQVANAALAVAAMRCLREPLIGEAAIRTGLAAVRFPGRLERMQAQPEVWLDGAHNAQKAAALASALRDLRGGRRLVLVLGVLASHQASDVVAPLAPLADALVCAAPSVFGKAPTPPEELAACCRPYCSQVEVVSRPLAAVERALTLAGSDGLVCVTGSLYLAGNARARWQSEADILRSAWMPAEDPLPVPLTAV
jgi:dihydrofolate synthase/folylpolyglutamate synthase